MRRHPVAAIRLVAYLVAIGASAALVGRLLAAKARLARVLAFAMAAWLFNSAILAAWLVWYLNEGDLTSPWREWTMTANAVVLAAAPVLLYAWLGRNGR